MSMPAMSMSVIEVLPALLNKTKTSTMRPLFCEAGSFNKSENHWGRPCSEIHKPRFKVGDKVKLYWHMRSKGLLFCSLCGKATLFKGEPPPSLFCKGAIEFPKLSGTVEIGAVDCRWLVGSAEGGVNVFETGPNGGRSYWSGEQMMALAKVEGFGGDIEGWRKMGAYFTGHYNIAEPRPFVQYHNWRWF